MSEMILSMPPSLQTIREEVIVYAAQEARLEAANSEWETYIAQVRKRIPEIHIKSRGEIIYLGDLSPGCHSCQSGNWDCIFTTMKCNLECSFCLRPRKIREGHLGSVFGSTPEEIGDKFNQMHITGISFSGGEPFADIDNLFRWISWFSAHYPDNYYWIYTNGLLVKEDYLPRLSALGIKEVRFNAAATGYNHSSVLAIMAATARHIPAVTVEIPAIPEDRDRVISALSSWCEAGVKFLNLHEFIYERGSYSDNFPGTRKTFFTPDGHLCQINPESRDLILEVMERVYEDNLPLSVNECSMQTKIRQLRGRRRMMAALTKSEHELLVAGGKLASCCAYQNNEVVFFHPDRLDEMRKSYADYNFLRIVRTVPLASNDSGRWVEFQKI